jgi:Zn-dependent peptidase ImmA (M78 family)/transcriptional regulator with XRE-family HTH domain
MMTAISRFEPKRLKIARQFHGYTQVELGDRVGVSRQFINQLETTEDRLPNEEMQAALAAALNVEPSFFSTPVVAELDTDDCNFRSILSRRARDVEQVLAHGVLLADLVSLVEVELDKAEMDFPAVDFPHIRVTDEESIERAAERVRLHWDLTADQPIDNTIRVAEHAGAVVVKFPGVAHEIDALSVCGDRPLIVRASEKEQQSRLRFDIAHEIGHLVMHQKKSRPDNHDLAEVHANRFASAFLLPRKPFMRAWPRGRRLDWHAIFQMKREWKVSAAAILHRASDLALIDAAQYRSGYVYLSKQGYRKSEPCEPVEEETPEVLRDALIQLQKISGVLPKDVARQLGVQPVILGKLLHLKMPDLREADASTVINLNARLDWSKAKWYV